MGKKINSVFVVITEKANFYNDNEYESSVKGVVVEGAGVYVEEEMGKFYKVEYGHQKGYMLKSKLEDTGVSGTSVGAMNSRAPLKKKPSKSSEVIEMVYKGQRIVLVDTSDPYFLVRTNKKKGFVYFDRFSY